MPPTAKLLAGLGLALAPFPGWAQTILQTATYNGHTYQLLSLSDWDTAEAKAVTLGGHLVTIDDAAENSFVLSTFSSTAIANAGPSGGVSLWLGLNDAAIEGTFVWTNGAPFSNSSYTNWHPGEPAGNYPTEDYIGMAVSFFTPGEWHDIVKDITVFNDRTFGVVEIAAIPEPAPTGLLLGTLALGYVRRKKGAPEIGRAS